MNTYHARLKDWKIFEKRGRKCKFVSILVLAENDIQAEQTAREYWQETIGDEARGAAVDVGEIEICQGRLKDEDIRRIKFTVADDYIYEIE